MTEYEMIRNELVSLGWSETQGRDDHRKFVKEGMRPITVSASISDEGRAFRNACANIRKVEPAFSLGKQAVSKEKEHRQRVNERIRRRQPLSDEEKAVMRHYSYIAPGNEVRYVTPENCDWNRLDDEHSVMNIPYRVVSVDGGYVKNGEELVEISCGDGNDLIVEAHELESHETGVCSCCGRRMPASRLLAEEDLRPCLGEETKATIDSIVDGKTFCLCMDCIGGFKQGAQKLASDLKKDRIDLLAREFALAMPEAMREMFSIRPDGTLKIVNGLPAETAIYITMAYKAWLSVALSRKMAPSARKETVKAPATKPTLYNLWSALRKGFDKTFTGCGFENMSYELTKDHSLPLMRVKLTNGKQADYANDIMLGTYQVLSDAGITDTFVRISCADTGLDLIHLPEMPREEKMKVMQRIREALPDAEKLLYHETRVLSLPEFPEMERILEGIIRKHLKFATYVFTAAIPEDPTEDVSVNIVLQPKNDEEEEYIRSFSKDFCHDFSEALGAGVTLFLQPQDVTEVDGINDIVRKEWIIDSHSLRRDTLAQEVLDQIRDSLDERYMQRYEKEINTREELIETLSNALMVYANVSEALDAGCREKGCTREEFWDHYGVTIFRNNATTTEIPNDMKATEIFQGMPQGEDLDRKLIESVDTKLLLKELHRRGVKMTNVQIPVTTYKEVNLDEI